MNHLVRYTNQTWDKYANAFGSITTNFQAAMLAQIALDLYGDVVDLGCGAAKIIPYLLDNPQVYTYVGVDQSPSMCTLATQVIEHLDVQHFRIEQNAIQQMQGQFDCLVSINSFYAWDEPELVLQHIKKLAKLDGLFILVTPNPSMDMQKLLYKAQRELIMHPYWETFKIQNLQLASNPQAHFLEMHQLLQMLMTAGYQVDRCHTDFYMGGLNTVYCRVIKYRLGN